MCCIYYLFSFYFFVFLFCTFCLIIVILIKIAAILLFLRALIIIIGRFELNIAKIDKFRYICDTNKNVTIDNRRKFPKPKNNYNYDNLNDIHHNLDPIDPTTLAIQDNNGLNHLQRFDCDPLNTCIGRVNGSVSTMLIHKKEHVFQQKDHVIVNFWWIKKEKV